MCNRTQNDAIWELIALFVTNKIAGNTIDFKMNVINQVVNTLLFFEMRYVTCLASKTSIEWPYCLFPILW